MNNDALLAGFDALNRGVKIEPGVGMTRHAQRAAVRRRRLDGRDMLGQPPFPLIRQIKIA
jgi:hypothetical protein